jgi:DNA replication protein DnaC
MKIRAAARDQEVKLLTDFDWVFNPKIPREKIMAFMQTDWLQKPSNLLLIGPSGIGNSYCLSLLLRRGPEGHEDRLPLAV